MEQYGLKLATARQLSAIRLISMLIFVRNTVQPLSYFTFLLFYLFTFKITPVS